MNQNKVFPLGKQYSDWISLLAKIKNFRDETSELSNSHLWERCSFHTSFVCFLKEASSLHSLCISSLNNEDASDHTYRRNNKWRKNLEKSAPSTTLKIRVQNGIQFESLGSETSREKAQINYSESKAKPGEAIEIFRKNICTKHYWKFWFCKQFSKLFAFYKITAFSQVLQLFDLRHYLKLICAQLCSGSRVERGSCIWEQPLRPCRLFEFSRKDQHVDIPPWKPAYSPATLSGKPKTDILIFRFWSH